MRRLVLFFALALAGCGGKVAASAPPQVATLVAPPRAMKLAGPPLESATYRTFIYSHPTTDPESSLPTAGGIVRVRAPIDVALRTATDFKNIYLLNPYIESSVVVGKEGDTTDVYIKVPTVIDQYVWAVVRFHPVAADKGHAYRGDMILGNLDDLRINWRLVPDGDETLAQFELLAEPALPLPTSWVVRDTRDGVYIMLQRFRATAEAHAQGKAGPDLDSDRVAP